MAQRRKWHASAVERRMGARFQAMRLRLRPDLANHQAFGDALQPPVTAQTIRNWESGHPIPDKAKRAICELIGCKAEDFYADDVPLNPGRLGFYGRPANTTVLFEADAHTKAACGVPADAPNELAWQRWYNRIHTDDHARVNAELERLNNPRDGVFNMQYRLLGVDGIERCIVDYGVMIFDSVGKAVRLQGLMLDITDEPRSNKTDDKIRRILRAVRPVLIALAAMLLACAGICEIQSLPCPWLTNADIQIYLLQPNAEST